MQQCCVGWRSVYPFLNNLVFQILVDLQISCILLEICIDLYIFVLTLHIKPYNLVYQTVQTIMKGHPPQWACCVSLILYMVS